MPKMDFKRPKKEKYKVKGVSKMANEYQEQALEFLRKANATMKIEVVGPGYSDWDDNNVRIQHRVTLTTPKGSYTFPFWGSGLQAEFWDTPSALEKVARKTFGRHYEGLINSEKAKIRKIIRERSEELKLKEYDVLAYFTAYDPGTHEDFCADFGYDTDSIRGLKTYLAVQKEYHELSRIFTPEQLEAIQEIS